MTGQGRRPHQDAVPKPALYAGIGIVCLALTSAIAGSMADIGAVRAPDVAIVQERGLRFSAAAGLDALAGEIAVIDAASGAEALVLADEGDGFIRGVLRALARDRMLSALPTTEADAQLVLWADGRLSIRDLATNTEIELSGFGADNRAAFQRLLAGET